MTTEAAAFARHAVRSATRDAFLARTGLAAGAATREVAPPTLLGIGTRQADDAAALLGRSFAWTDDMLCFERASLGAHMVNQRLGAGLVAGPDDAVRAAVAIVETSPMKTGWAFHAATVYRDDATQQLRVIDRLTEPSGGSMPLTDWARLLGRDAADVRIQHPFAAAEVDSLLSARWDGAGGRALPLRDARLVASGGAALDASISRLEAAGRSVAAPMAGVQLLAG